MFPSSALLPYRHPYALAVPSRRTPKRISQPNGTPAHEEEWASDEDLDSWETLSDTTTLTPSLSSSSPATSRGPDPGYPLRSAGNRESSVAWRPEQVPAYLQSLSKLCQDDFSDLSCLCIDLKEICTDQEDAARRPDSQGRRHILETRAGDLSVSRAMIQRHIKNLSGSIASIFKAVSRRDQQLEESQREIEAWKDKYDHLTAENVQLHREITMEKLTRRELQDSYSQFDLRMNSLKSQLNEARIASYHQLPKLRHFVTSSRSNVDRHTVHRSVILPATSDAVITNRDALLFVVRDIATLLTSKGEPVSGAAATTISRTRDGGTGGPVEEAVDEEDSLTKRLLRIRLPCEQYFAPLRPLLDSRLHDNRERLTMQFILNRSSYAQPASQVRIALGKAVPILPARIPLTEELEEVLQTVMFVLANQITLNGYDGI